VDIERVWTLGACGNGKVRSREEVLDAYALDTYDAAAAHLPGWYYPATAAAMTRELTLNFGQYVVMQRQAVLS
jgi:hypothetical protein